MNEASPSASADTGAKVCTTCGARFPGDALFCPKDGTPLDDGAPSEERDPYIGQEISGHIEIKQLVGVGAMGRVYRAFQRSIDRDVAVKILHRELSANAQLVSRFTREAKVASRLSHPNVVQVLLAGQLPDRALYMVMEYLDGLSLQGALSAASDAMPLERALHVALQLCDAVGEAHAQGIVHRDLKPENVMLVRRASDPDFVKVLDFGIARLDWGEQSVATAAGLIFGTARYISPEGAQGNAVTPASDVYSIATLLYQMLSGRTPFEGDQAVGILVSQIHDVPPKLRSLERAAYVPEPIADLVMANLAKDPKDREVDARALGAALVAAAKRSGLQAEGSRVSQPEIPARSGQRITAATAKWEPPADFQAKLAVDVAAAKARTPSRVDETLDDDSNEPPVAVAFPAPTPLPAVAATPTPSVPKTLAGNEASGPRTAYETPVADPAGGRTSETIPPEKPRRAAAAAREGGSRGIAFVVLCFVLGVLLTAGVAWKMGKLGSSVADDQDRVLARANDAVFKNKFVEPPGENVRDITDEGLRRWPGERRLLDVRSRAANQLVTQAMAQRSSGDIAEALRLARVAHQLAPDDASAERLVEQYEAEFTAFSASPSPPPLAKPPAPPLGSTLKSATAPPPVHDPGGYKVLLDVSTPAPRLGQNVDLTARVAPAKGSFDQPSFIIAGPGVPGGIRMPAQAAAPGVFKASYSFLESGRFEVVFMTQVGQVTGGETKVLRATRNVQAGDAPPPLPSAAPGPAPSALPGPSPSPSVKWM